MPEFRELNFRGFKPAREPLYEDYTYELPRMNQHTMYRGDDYGGHNIPFPHPQPPKPVGVYEDAFVDLAEVFGIERNFDSPNDDDLIRFGGFGKSQADTYSSRWIDSPYGYFGSDFGMDIYGGDDFLGDAYLGDAYLADDYEEDYRGDDYLAEDSEEEFRRNAYHGDDYRGDAYRGNAYRAVAYRGDAYLADHYEEDYRGDTYRGDDHREESYGPVLEAEKKSFGGYEEAEDLSYGPSREDDLQRRLSSFRFLDEDEFDARRDERIERKMHARRIPYQGERQYRFRN